jgi:signal peptidase
VSSVAQSRSSIADAYARAYVAERAGGRPRALRVPAGRQAPALGMSARVTPRWALKMLVYATLGFSIGIALAVTAPLAFGFKSFTILSGSMEPAISTGDVVVVKRIDPSEARIGDVVSFRDPENPTRVLSHRVTRIRAADGSIAFVTKGDANTGVERWQMPEDGTIGRVEFRIPKLGYVTNRVGSRFGRLAFLVLPALLLAFSELYKIWRPQTGTSDSAARE